MRAVAMEPPSQRVDHRAVQGNRFRPNSARAARHGTVLPPAAVAMQLALARAAPAEVREFYRRRLLASAKLQRAAGG